MRVILVVLDNGQSSQVEIPDELSQDEAITQIEGQLPEGTSIASLEQVSATEAPVDPAEQELESAIQGAEQYLSRDDRASEFMSQWDGMNLTQQAQAVSKQFGVPVPEAYEKLVSRPHEALAEMKAVALGEEQPGYGSRLYAGLKDAGSGAGRVIGAGVDALLGGGDADFMESMSKRGGEMPSEAERGLFGAIGQSIVRDPFIAPMAAVMPHLAVESQFAKIPYLASKPIVQKAIASGVEGLAEETARGGLESLFEGAKFDPAQIALGGGISGGMGAGSGALGKYSKDLFKTLPTQAVKKRLGGVESPKAAKVLGETYEDLGGLFDYNIPKRLDKIKAEQARLGKTKGQSYEELAKMSDPAEELVGKQQSAQAFGDETQKIINLVEDRKVSPPAAKDYLEELKNVEQTYFEGVGPYMPETSPTADMASTIQDLGDIPVKRAEAEVADIAGNVLGGSYEGDIVKLFNARKSLDADLKRAYDKAGQGIKLGSKDEAYLFGRQKLNDQINTVIDAVSTKIQTHGTADDMARFGQLTEALDETKALEGLYNQESVLRGIGGGNIEKTSTSLFSKQGIPGMGTAFPPSGIRQRQIGNLLGDPIMQPVLKEATYRDEDAPIFPLFGGSY